MSWDDEVEEYGDQEEVELGHGKADNKKAGKGVGGKRGRPRKVKDEEEEEEEEEEGGQHRT